MKYFINNIVKKIKHEIEKNNNNKVLVKIENFQDIRIYENVSIELEKYCLQNNIKLLVKLSKKKYEEEQARNPIGLNVFKNKNWIDHDNHMTSYRNNLEDTKRLILILATELVEDRGGLEDFYLIEPHMLDAEIKNDYHKLFIEKFDINQIKCAERELNMLFKTIFSYYEKNLYKLSVIIDEAPVSFMSKGSLLDYFSSNFDKHWLFPKIQNVYETFKNGDSTLLKKALKFSKRSDYKDLTKRKLEKIINNLAIYRSQILENEEMDLATFDEISSNLLNYVEGKDLENARSYLFSQDFSIINDILEIKIKKEKLEKDDKMKLEGEPFIVFTKAIIAGLCEIKEEKLITLNDVVIDIEDIGFANSSTEAELEEVWARLCYSCGGLLDYINIEEALEIEGKTINLSYATNSEVFSYGNLSDFREEKLVRSLSSSINLSKIAFNVIFLSKEETILKKKIEWSFSNSEAFLMNYSYIDSDLREEIDRESKPYIPDGKIRKLKDFENINDELEFFDLLEKNSISIEKNLLDNKFSGELRDKLVILGHSFHSYIAFLIKRGFFSTLIAKTIPLLEKYEMLLDTFISQELDVSNVYDYRIVSELFLILDDNCSITSGRDITAAIVPPYSPVTLEKLFEKYSFLRSNLPKIFSLAQVLDYSKVVKELDKIEELSVIQSTVDVLLGEKKSILDTKGVYGDYTLLCHKTKSKENKRLISFNSLLKKENGITDEPIKPKMSVMASLIASIISKYMDFNNVSLDGLKLAFINPTELEPIIAGLVSLGEGIKHFYTSNKLNINLSVYLHEENIGGRSYLAYWAENNFDEDTYINLNIRYITHTEVDNIIHNLEDCKEEYDIVFVMDLLEEGIIDFRQNSRENDPQTQNKFPMIHLPILSNHTDKRRSIELSQTQFNIATKHSKIVNALCGRDIAKNNVSIIKEYIYTNANEKLLENLKNKSSWVACLDRGIDQSLLGEKNQIIGFYTGQGSYGEYNLAVLGNDKVLSLMEQKLKTRLKISLKLDDTEIRDISRKCMGYISKLNGLKVLEAVNVKDYAINNFLAYYLTYNFIKNKKSCWGIIPLDFYQNWFLTVGNMPDFLIFEVNTDKQKVNIKLSLVECKFAEYLYQSTHITKAINQIKAGLESLTSNFNNKSKEQDRRYWFSQLYKALVHFTRSDDLYPNESKVLGEDFKKILDGNFQIEWEGKVFAFWHDMPGESINQERLLSTDSIVITKFEFPQRAIKRLLMDEPITQNLIIKQPYSSELVNIAKLVDNTLKSIKQTKEEFTKNINIVEREKITVEEVEIFSTNNINNQMDKLDNDLDKIQVDEKYRDDIVIIEKNQNDEIEDLRETVIVEEDQKGLEMLSTTNLYSDLISVLDNEDSISHYEDEFEYAWKKLQELLSVAGELKIKMYAVGEPQDCIIVGPHFNRLKFKLEIGQRIDSLKNRMEDIQLHLNLNQVPILHVEDGFLCMDIPRLKSQTMKIAKELEKFSSEDYRNGLKFILGVNEKFNPQLTDLGDKHLLIAGSSGCGKSVLINSIITNLMIAYSAKELNFVFIDPKQVELQIYNGIPHLVRSVIKDAKEAYDVLEWLNEEQNRRYELMASIEERNLRDYNLQVSESDRLPRILLVFDEFADFVLDEEYGSQITLAMQKLSQKARAAGIHLLIATQSPKANVISTNIRNNMQLRVAMKVPDGVASKVICDRSGAELLRGNGDMYFLSDSSPQLNRLQSLYISTDEVKAVKNKLIQLTGAK